MTTYTDVLEIAFLTPPYSTSPVFTNVSAWLLPDTIEVTFGRPDEFGEVAPATLAFKLDNSDGRFTQGKIDSPYAPNVLIGRRVRWSRLRDGVRWQRFDGHINNFPTRWHATDPTWSEAEITATDRGKRLGRPGELRSPPPRRTRPATCSPPRGSPRRTPAARSTSATAPAQGPTASPRRPSPPPAPGAGSTWRPTRSRSRSRARR